MQEQEQRLLLFLIRAYTYLVLLDEAACSTSREQIVDGSVVLQWSSRIEWAERRPTCHSHVDHLLDVIRGCD